MSELIWICNLCSQHLFTTHGLVEKKEKPVFFCEKCFDFCLKNAREVTFQAERRK